MNPAARLLRLLSLLQARSEWPTAELSTRLGVDPRTIRRDVARLRELGYPVLTNPGRAGYRLGNGGRLPPLLLDDDEAVAITLGLRLATTTATGGVGTAAVAALGKLDQVLPQHLRDRVRAVDAATVHLFDRSLAPIAVDTLILLATACRRSERIRFGYEDHNGVHTERRADPIQVVHGNHWYVVAFDRDRTDWRTFRVDRIADLTLTGHTFHIDEPPDAASLVLEGTTVAARPIQARIWLDLPADTARRRYREHGVVEATKDGQAILRVGANHLAHLARFAAGLDCEWEVLSPPEVRAELRRLARSIARRHKR